MNTNDAIYRAAPKRFQAPICDRTTTAEITGDFTLPDYQPEIRRILRVSLSPLPPAKYVGGSNAEICGTLDYDLLYIGSDGELYSAPLSSEYSFTLPLDITSELDLNEGIIMLCDLSEENLTARLSAPRRLTLRTRLSARVRAYGTMVAEEKSCGEADPLCVERLEKRANASKTVAGFGETISLSDEISAPSENTRIVSATSCVVASEVTAQEGAALCRGEVILRILVCDEGDTKRYETLTKSIPFSESIAIDDLTPDAVCRARGQVSDLTLSVEDGKILCDVSLIPEIIGNVSAPITYSEDLYSTENLCQTSYRDYSLPTVFSIKPTSLSQSERVPIAESGIKQGSRIIDVRCRASADKLETEANKYILSGQCKYSLLLECEGEYSASELLLPFRYEGECEGENIRGHFTSVLVTSCRARCDGANLAIDSELCISGELFGESHIMCVSEVSFGDKIAREDGDIIICFPAPDDTAWSVSKRYFVPVNRISGVTSAEELLSGYVVINK